MLLMSVTLDVSKASGWLIFFAYCRVEGGRQTMWGEVRVGKGGRVRQRRHERRASAWGFEPEAMGTTGHARSSQ